MKLVTFSTPELPKPHLGLVQNDEVLDVDLAGRALQLTVPDSMLALLAQNEQGQQAMQALLAKANNRPFSQVKTFTDVGAVHTLQEVKLHAPIPQPRKNVICMAVNYAEHARETANVRERATTAPPTSPILFTKATTTINAPNEPFVIDPTVSEEIDWEIELGVIIGKGGKHISEADALSHVFGYTIINDITARDLQARHKQFFLGKSLDGSCPIGPYIVTADEIADPQKLSLRLRVNGEIKQDSNTSEMVFPIPTIIATLSAVMTLEPGDIIATGTPSGVGFSRTPPEFLRPNDIVECEVEGLGILRTPIK